MDTRKTDMLGRIVIPKDLRIRYGIESEGSEIDIIPTEDGILLKKHTAECAICRVKENLVTLDGKSFCKSCIDKLNKLV